MKFSPLIDQLVSSFTCLPGVGPKSAQRMAFHLLERNREAGQQLSAALHDAMAHVKHCRQCRTFTESELCQICAHPQRGSHQQLCVVESPQDILAIEQSAEFHGRYFVLMGHLSPLDGIGPGEIGLDQLAEQFEQGGVAEVILATNPTVEGEATAHYINQMCQSRQITASRIAHGVPVGGELEYLDGNTLSYAFSGRRQL